MKRVLVTGADGFVGRHVLPLLENSNLEIHAILFPGNALPEGSESVHWHELDLMHSESRKKLFKLVKATHLLHLAWVTEWGKYWNSPKNLDWLKSGLDMFREFSESGGQRIVGAGTCAEYDWWSGVCREGVTPLRPTSLYGACKQALHLVWGAYAGQAGLSCAWGRLFFIYGPYESPQRLVPSTILSLQRGERTRCRAGRARRDYLHVEDAAAAFAALLVSPVQGAVNIASGEALSLGDLVGRIAAMVGRPSGVEIEVEEPNPAESPLVAADVTRLRSEVGVSPAVSLEEGLRRSVAWWREHSEWGMAP